MKFVIANIPRTGLGNKLFVWAKAYIFAKKNHKKLIVWGWVHVSKNNLMFWRKNSRIYAGYFNNKFNLWYLIKYWIRLILFRKSICDENQLENCNNCKIVEFNKIPHWSDFFKGIRENYELVTEGFFNMLKPDILSEYKNLKNPVLAVHIRMGDFRKLKPGEDFKKVGGVRTPMEYFINCIHEIRKKTHQNLPVTIFSDGNNDELKEILMLPNVEKSENTKDILDLLQMSKAEVIICSAGSTFSFWASFFSRAIVLIHPDHFHSYIRPSTINSLIYEGSTPKNWEKCPELLEKNLQSLKLKYSNS